jgi:hypothetical protein
MPTPLSQVKMNLQQLQTPFHFFFFARGTHQLRGMWDAMSAPPNGKEKKMCERKIVLIKRGQGLVAKADFLCVLTNQYE